MTNHVPPDGEAWGLQTFLPSKGWGRGCCAHLPVGTPGHLLPARASVGQTLVRLAESLLLGTTLYAPNSFMILVFENVAKAPR